MSQGLVWCMSEVDLVPAKPEPCNEIRIIQKSKDIWGFTKVSNVKPDEWLSACEHAEVTVRVVRAIDRPYMSILWDQDIMIYGMQASGGLASLFGVGQPRENQYQYVWCVIAMEEALCLSCRNIAITNVWLHDLWGCWNGPCMFCMFSEDAEVDSRTAFDLSFLVHGSVQCGSWIENSLFDLQGNAAEGLGYCSESSRKDDSRHSETIADRRDTVMESPVKHWTQIQESLVKIIIWI